MTTHAIVGSGHTEAGRINQPFVEENGQVREEDPVAMQVSALPPGGALAGNERDVECRMVRSASHGGWLLDRRKRRAHGVDDWRLTAGAVAGAMMVVTGHGLGVGKLRQADKPGRSGTDPLDQDE